MTAPSYASEYAHLDGVEDATLYVVDKLGALGDEGATGKALKKTVQQSRFGSSPTAPDATAGDVEIVWWRLDDDDPTPRPRDVIELEDDGTRWVVIAVGDRERWGPKWRCLCRKEV